MQDDEGFWSAIVTFWRVRLFAFKDLCRTIFYFWRKPKFALVDLFLLGSYFFQSPYRIARLFFRGESPYGETPLVVMCELAEKAGITSADTVYELGSGRGRTSFWLAVFLGCRKVVGVECVPTFVAKAQTIARFFRLQNVIFLQEDMCGADLKEASVIYLFGTCLSDKEIHTLNAHFARLAKGTKIITISYSLIEYNAPAAIHLEQSFDVTFVWGETTAYIHVVQ